MNGSVFADSTVSSGSSRSGSVSRILRSTRVLGDRPVRVHEAPLEQLRQVGRVAHVVGERG